MTGTYDVLCTECVIRHIYFLDSLSYHVYGNVMSTLQATVEFCNDGMNLYRLLQIRTEGTFRIKTFR